MKKKISQKTKLHILNFIKLCYILIILCALYTLKVVIYPESTYEILIMPYQIYLMLECIFHATLILIIGNALLIRLL